MWLDIEGGKVRCGLGTSQEGFGRDAVEAPLFVETADSGVGSEVLDKEVNNRGSSINDKRLRNEFERLAGREGGDNGGGSDCSGDKDAKGDMNIDEGDSGRLSESAEGDWGGVGDFDGSEADASSRPKVKIWARGRDARFDRLRLVEGTGSSSTDFFTFSPISVTDHVSWAVGLRAVLPTFFMERRAFVARALKVFDLDIVPPLFSESEGGNPSCFLTLMTSTTSSSTDTGLL